MEGQNDIPPNETQQTTAPEPAPMVHLFDFPTMPGVVLQVPELVTWGQMMRICAEIVVDMANRGWVAMEGAYEQRNSDANSAG